MEHLPADLMHKIWIPAFVGSSKCMAPNKHIRNEYWHPFWVQWCLGVVNESPKSREQVEKELFKKHCWPMAWSVAKTNAVDAKATDSLMNTAKYIFICIVLKQHKTLNYEEIYRVCYNLCLLKASGRLHNLLHKFLAITFRYHHRTDPEHMMLAFKMLEDTTMHLNNKVCPQKGWRTARQTIGAYVEIMNETDDAN
tara:strand:- start:724 stop:1311 length:588 start_codon:yes stop_codon:yes gene_type:complete